MYKSEKLKIEREHEMSSLKDITRLRNLAGRYAQIVNSEEMNIRRKTWRQSNRLMERTIPFVIEDNGTFFKDLLPQNECDGETEREFESYMLRVIYNYELIPDDRVYPAYYPLGWLIHRPDMCPGLKITRAADSTGRELGYETNTPLADLDKGLKILTRGKFQVAREETYRKAELAGKIFGDILPVKIRCYETLGMGVSLIYRVVTWMGMENFYMAMIDQPENVHKLLDFICREYLDFMQWLETENLIRPNHGEFICGSGSIGYTDELPRSKTASESSWRPEDCWGAAEAQEAVGISGDMFAEFIFPYLEKTTNRFGLLYYGCCEPVHAIWKTVKRFRNLRKVTVSPWCDQEIIAEAVGKDYVLSRKPHPLKMCGESFDQELFAEHIKETLDITKDNFVELIFRDTCTLNGTMKGRISEACNIVKKLIGR